MKSYLKLAFMALAVSTLTVSCSKDGDSTTSTGNSWKVGSKSYTQFMCTSQNMGPATALIAFTKLPSGSSTIDRLSVYFKTKPTANGSYKIVYKPNLTDLLADEVYVDAAEETGNMNAVAKADGKLATVTVSGGKVSVTIPTNSAYYGVFNTSLNQTTTVEGTITEQ